MRMVGSVVTAEVWNRTTMARTLDWCSGYCFVVGSALAAAARNLAALGLVGAKETTAFHVVNQLDPMEPEVSSSRRRQRQVLVRLPAVGCGDAQRAFRALLLLGN
mmetsp:Transcript_2955/g.6225  ORF Transcript_2955/g.6225 Transcript_2955/m.6225 type:complete len:105 (+) Transcript_2955:219-533(+)